MSRITFVHHSTEPIGVTFQRSADGTFRDGAAWVTEEPKPIPLVRDPYPAEPRASVVFDDSDWPSGNYSVTVWKLDEAGERFQIVTVFPCTVPAPPVILDIRSSIGFAGR